MVNGSYADYVRDRVLEVANYTLLTKKDIRSIAKVFNVSKSTIHKDLSERLTRVDPLLYSKIKMILAENKHQGQLNGGRSTREKYRGCFEQ